MASSELSAKVSQLLGKEIDKKVVIGAVVVAYIVILMVFVGFYYMPRSQELSALTEEEFRNQLTIKQLDKYKATIPELERQIEDTKTMIGNTAASTPRDIDMAIVLDIIAEFAQANGLILESLDHSQVDWNWASTNKQLPSEIKDVNTRDLGQVRVNSAVKGQYNNIVTFVSSIEHTFTNVRFEDIRIETDSSSNGSSESGRVQAQFSWSLWVLRGDGKDVRFEGEWTQQRLASTRIPSWRNPFQPYRLPVSVSAVKELVTDGGKPIRLSGVAKSERDWRAVLLVGGTSYLAKPGDQIEGMRVLDVTSEGVSMWINGEPKFIKLGEGGKR